MSEEHPEATERNYEQMINSQSHGLESNGVAVSQAYSGAETLPTTSIATVVSNIPGSQVLVAAREIQNEKEKICISNQIIAHPEHSSSTIYHDQIDSGEGGLAYRWVIRQ